MSDSAFPTAAYPGLTDAELRAAMAKGCDRSTMAKMEAELSRRAKVRAGNTSVMTPGERLRHVRKMMEA
jgi:hypothetical protein